VGLSGAATGSGGLSERSMGVSALPALLEEERAGVALDPDAKDENPSRDALVG